MFQSPRLYHFFFLLLFVVSSPVVAQFKITPHRLPVGNEVAVSGPGVYAKAGTTYVLVKDITSSTSTVFLGKDVTLDLNGYTIRYADGKYIHILNSGFEEGAKGWDLSKAPGAKVVSTKAVHVFIGQKLMSLKAGDEITSAYIHLPVATRSYFAMCGVTGFDYHEMKANLDNQMRVSVYVEDANGKEVHCNTEYGDTTEVSCPMENRAPRLGGGFIYAHLHHLPAGDYRVRVKAETDCLVDEIDIRPAMDVGIGIVEKTYPMGHYDHLYNSILAAFFDYTKDVANGTPLPGIPVVEGEGAILIRNGVIENATKGVVSWGIQSTATQVKIILDNVKIKTTGINSTAADLPQATITNCRFEVDNPFIINRHFANFYAVDLRGDLPSEVSFSEFYGGQGCLVFKGDHSSVHHNFFANRQMVTNHYSIMAMGDSSKIFANNIEPETGSGIEIYIHRGIEIFNNTFKIKTSPPTCEYGHEEYSTSAIRMADYQASPGSPEGCYGNKVYNNKISITAIDTEPGDKRYTPMSWAIYYSASAGDNDVFGNDITINKPMLSSKAITTAFYICGGPKGSGGRFYDNRVVTNVPAAWVASMYGGTSNTKIFHNTIIRSATARADFKPFRMGAVGCDWCVAKNIEFRSNNISGAPFEIAVTDQEHTYAVYWTLGIKVMNDKKDPVKNAGITIRDKNNAIVAEAKTGDDGRFETGLPSYNADGKNRSYLSPYTIQVAGEEKKIDLVKNEEISFSVK